MAEAIDSFAEGRLADDLAMLAVQRLELPGPTQQKPRCDSAGSGGLAGR